MTRVVKTGFVNLPTIGLKLGAVVFDPQPVSLAPIDQQILIYAPELSSGWVKAIRKFPMANRTARPHWKVLGAGCYGYMHGDFEPMAWLPLEAAA